MRKNIKKQQQAGFTLIELIITMALMAAFAVVLTDILTSALDTQKGSEANSALSQDGRFILARLDYDIQRATSITTPATLGSSSANLVLVIGGVNYTYALSGSDLQLTDGSGSVNLNSNNSTISALSFQRIGNVGGKETVRIGFTATSVVRSEQGLLTRSFTTAIGRR